MSTLKTTPDLPIWPSGIARSGLSTNKTSFWAKSQHDGSASQVGRDGRGCTSGGVMVALLSLSTTRKGRFEGLRRGTASRTSRHRLAVFPARRL